VHHALRFELFNHPPGGQLIVLRPHQQPRHSLERLQKAREIREPVKRLRFGKRQRSLVVALAQLHQRSGQNRAFEMQMQLGLRQPADEILNSLHGSSLPGVDCAF
jgi:hypothetical protein